MTGSKQSHTVNGFVRIWSGASRVVDLFLCTVHSVALCVKVVREYVQQLVFIIRRDLIDLNGRATVLVHFDATLDYYPLHSNRHLPPNRTCSIR